jgi:hypothetical protein
VKKWIALLMLAAVAALPLAASAAEGFVYADVLSAYVFNGQVGNDEAVFQPGLDVSGPLGLGYSIWANMDLTDSERSWAPDSAYKWSEFDLDLTWAAPLKGPVSLTLGGRFYVFPQDTSGVELNADNTVAEIEQHPADGGYELFVKAKA